MMNKQHAKHMADAYCDGVCETGLAGLCPGDGCCEVYPHNVKHFMTADIGHIEEDEIKKEKYEYTTFIHIHVEGMDRLNALCLKGWKVDNVFHRNRADVTLLLCRKR